MVGNLITVLLQISSRLRHWKNFENRPVFAKVMPKILLVRFFSGHGVVIASGFPNVPNPAVEVYSGHSGLRSSPKTKSCLVSQDKFPKPVNPVIASGIQNCAAIYIYFPPEPHCGSLQQPFRPEECSKKNKILPSSVSRQILGYRFLCSLSSYFSSQTRIRHLNIQNIHFGDDPHHYLDPGVRFGSRSGSKLHS